MSKILIIYSTTDGHTRKICQRLQQNIEKNGDQVELIVIEEVSPVELEAFDKIVIGASIRYGKHSPAVYAFISDNVQILESKRNAFFTVNVVARKPEKNQPDTNPYLKKFLTQIAWQPQKFGGVCRKNQLPDVSIQGPIHDPVHHVDYQGPDSPGYQCRIY